MSLSSTEAARLVRRKEAGREALRNALESILSGADFADADAVLDHLDDLGFRVEPVHEP